MKFSKQEIKIELLKAAQSQQKDLYYSKLAEIIPGIKKNKIRYDKKFFKTLELIGIQEYKAGQPLINALVIRKDTNLPGKRFFEWYIEYIEDYKEKGKSEKQLFEECQKKCFEHWSKILESDLEKYV